MAISVTQYGAIFAANNCRLNFNSKEARLEVAQIPRNLRKIIEAAVADIDHFEDTSNFSDGLAAIHLAATIDGDPNPIPELVKANVLTALGILKDGRFIAQNIAQQKTNRSWHISDKPNMCSYFGDICTNRGIQNIPGKRGRKSTRTPDQYHILSRGGEILREQLVTPALEALVAAIPAANLISVTPSSTAPVTIGGISLDSLTEDQIAEVVSKIKEIAAKRESANGVLT